jgi:hypothetical protein
MSVDKAFLLWLCLNLASLFPLCAIIDEAVNAVNLTLLMVQDVPLFHSQQDPNCI